MGGYNTPDTVVETKETGA